MKLILVLTHGYAAALGCWGRCARTYGSVPGYNTILWGFSDGCNRYQYEYPPPLIFKINKKHKGFRFDNISINAY